MNTRYPRLKNSRQEAAKQKEHDRQIFKIAETIALAVFNDCYDCTVEEVQEFADHYHTLLDSIYADTDDVKEIERILVREYGIELKDI